MPSILQFLSTHIPHFIGGALLAIPAYKVGRWACEKLGGWAWEQTVGAFKADRQRLANTDANISLMMVNHLPHIQAGLDKLVEEHQQTNLILAEQSGYLRGILEKK